MKYLYIIIALFVISCSTSSIDEIRVEDMLSPAKNQSGEPAFFQLSNAETGMSWVETDGESNSVKFSVYKNSNWTEPFTIASGENILANWADFPGIITNGSDWVAWYLQMTNVENFAYDVMIMQSSDNGNSWTEPQKLHSDSTQTEHGFVSAAPSDGGFQLIWLDGRFATDMAGNFTLRTAFLNFEGAISHRAILDDNTCTCCQTSLVNINSDFIALYRDRSEEDIRDIATVKFNNLEENLLVNMVNNDNWHIAGCPVNGPRSVVNRDKIGVVWFTMGTDGVPKVQFATSNDGGVTYTAPLLIDTNNLGRVDILASGGSYYISYLDKAEDESVVKITEVQDGKIVDTTTIASVSSSRKTGFPRMALAAYDVGIFIAYTDVESNKVKLKHFSF